MKSGPNHLRLSHNVNHLQKTKNRHPNCKSVIKIKLNVICLLLKSSMLKPGAKKMVCAYVFLHIYLSLVCGHQFVIFFC